MIAINAAYLKFIGQFKDLRAVSLSRLKAVETASVIYITFITSWGSVVSLIDQKLYGQVISFMVNLVICSIFYYLDSRKILIPFAVSFLILCVGLPFFQPSGDILIGHYVNLSIFVLISWTASRLVYNGYCEDFKGKVLLNESKKLIENEIQEKKEINVRLEIANRQLRELALVDDLTGIANRRSFRHYIDMIFKDYANQELVLSVMMIDIDFFKQYNDHYGHEAGDQALIAVAGQINTVLRTPMEFAGRWGGEEFIYAVFNPDEDIMQLADDVRQKVAQLEIPHNYSPGGQILTVTVGVSKSKVSDREDVRKAIALADKAMYQAKNDGRDRVGYLEKV
jgi:diguanylate cyclase (GGDEF)-like protein